MKNALTQGVMTSKALSEKRANSPIDMIEKQYYSFPPLIFNIIVSIFQFIDYNYIHNDPILLYTKNIEVFNFIRICVK